MQTQQHNPTLLGNGNAHHGSYTPSPAPVQQHFAPPPVATPPPRTESVSPISPPRQQQALPFYPGPPANMVMAAEKHRTSFTAEAPTSPNMDQDQGVPASIQFSGASATVDDVGTFNGGSFRVSHRDSNTILTIQLAIGCPLTVKSGTLLSLYITHRSKILHPGTSNADRVCPPQAP